MKLELNPETVAAAIVAEVDRKGNGLSTQHEQQMHQFIVRLLTTHEVKKVGQESKQHTERNK